MTDFQPQEPQPEQPPVVRSSKSQRRTGTQSHLIRLSAIVIGIGIAEGLYFGWRMGLNFVIPGIIILLIGVFRSRPTDGTQDQVETSEKVGPVPRKGLVRNTKIIVGCGTAFITVIVLICAGAGYFVYTLRDSETLGIKVNYPKTVHVGDNFELTLNLENNGGADIKVQDIDLRRAVSGNDDSILAGSTVTRTEPSMESYEIPLGKMREYLYDGIVKPGETQKVIFYFRAEKPGEFHTDVFVDMGNALSAVYDIVISIAP